MRALVTGGAGFIGSNLVDKLLEGDNEVVVLDCLSTGSLKNIEHNFSNKKFKFVNDDILNRNTVEELIRESDIIFHLAAVVGVKYIVEDPLKTMLVNVRGTENIFISASKFWKKVVLASSSEVYGKSKNVPLKEDDDRVLGPTHIDRWSYSASKVIDEHIAFSYSKKGLPVAILRFFNAYGPRINELAYGTVVAQFIKQALRGDKITVHNKGEQTRCFTYIDDIVNGILLTSSVKLAEGEVFNLGNDVEMTILELAKKIKETTNSKSEITFIPYSDYYGLSYEDTPRRVPSIEKAKKILGYKPKVSIEEGLRKTILWCKENYELR